MTRGQQPSPWFSLYTIPEVSLRAPNALLPPPPHHHTYPLLLQNEVDKAVSATVVRENNLCLNDDWPPST